MSLLKNKTILQRLVVLYRLILSDRNTRNLFFFLLVNLIFAFVELSYGLLTNSLGLISDSFHMFFDCSALLLGLAASIVTKRGPNDKFTYGFGRAEVLAGLANGLFLLFIALFIMKEAIERTFEPPEVHHERLFVISVLGFLVNLIGIFVFQHGGQGHHHHGPGGGCSHSAANSNSKHEHQVHEVAYKYDNQHGYSHYSNPVVLSDPAGAAHKHSHGHHNSHQHHHNGNNNHSAGSVALDMNGYGSQVARGPNDGKYAPSDAYYVTDPNLSNTKEPLLDVAPNLIHHDHHHHPRDHHEHSGGGGGHHRGQIMQSVFLHIVADTLGSVGVMISALLMNQFGLMIADPLCSLFIAVLIAVSVFPLLRDSMYILMQRLPFELDSKLPECLYKIEKLEGVLSVHETHFWTLYSDTYIGCLKLLVTPSANYGLVQERTKRLLYQLGVSKVHIQIDYAQ